MKLFFTLALARYSLPLLAGTIQYSGAEYTYTVQQTGIYQLTAYGAQGGGESAFQTLGGGGAIVTADFALVAGQQLDIYVGGQPATPNYFGAGGGGTFVVLNGSPLLVAGGGGGGGLNANGVNASLTPDGTPDQLNQNSGGTNGGAGSGQGAGAGFYTACPAADNQGCGYAAFSGGDSLPNSGANGGFGGGGGSGQNVNGFIDADGGGGGYSGGGSSNYEAYSGGGGGGSYVDASALSSSSSSTFNFSSTGQVENGKLDINLVSVPEPAALALFGLGLVMAIPGARPLRRKA